MAISETNLVPNKRLNTTQKIRQKL